MPNLWEKSSERVGTGLKKGRKAKRQISNGGKGRGEGKGESGASESAVG